MSKFIVTHLQYNITQFCLSSHHPFLSAFIPCINVVYLPAKRRTKEFNDVSKVVAILYVCISTVSYLIIYNLQLLGKNPLDC